jgi:hypothetical protein
MNEQEQVSADLLILDQPDYFKLWQEAMKRCIQLEDRVDFYRQIAEMNADTIKSMVAARNGSAH